MFLYLKAAHIIFVVSWFAGLFYIVRLFIYHTEAQDRDETERLLLQSQYKVMEKRLWQVITAPAMAMTLITGAAMLALVPNYLSQPWMHVKLLFVAVLLAYHYRCQVFLKDLQRDRIKRSAKMLRIWNEVATMLLVAIVFVVVLKSILNWIWGVVGLVLLGVTLLFAIRLYGNLRK